ncbi:hypothetical protein JRO89_XS05G0244200 [Xanthoceras sorbifolium]|uniref:Uncharacterized protein n=1 Tax=Xanthoceras sorbifolium TaxID=99658 RepID=A0ABQ8I353_9ROSI|nr:hypothetical protein JRO89_XS05G0244200 [Xanthoceras sorbifolium]
MRDTEKINMEESLLQPPPPPTSILERPEEEEEKINNFPPTTRDVLFTEVKRLGVLAGPMVALTLSQYLLQVISLMMVGHLSELALSSAAITISLSGVTGFSLLVSVAIFKLLQ